MQASWILSFDLLALYQVCRVRQLHNWLFVVWKYWTQVKSPFLHQFAKQWLFKVQNFPIISSWSFHHWKFPTSFWIQYFPGDWSSDKQIYFLGWDCDIWGFENMICAFVTSRENMGLQEWLCWQMRLDVSLVSRDEGEGEVREVGWGKEGLKGGFGGGERGVGGAWGVLVGTTLHPPQTSRGKSSQGNWEISYWLELSWIEHSHDREFQTIYFFICVYDQPNLLKILLLIIKW